MTVRYVMINTLVARYLIGGVCTSYVSFDVKIWILAVVN